jgi:hypothetical protein
MAENASNLSRANFEEALKAEWDVLEDDDISASRGDIEALTDIIRARTGESEAEVRARIGRLMSEGGEQPVGAAG